MCRNNSQFAFNLKRSDLKQRIGAVFHNSLFTIFFVLIFVHFYAIIVSKVGGEVLPEYLVKCSKCGKSYIAKVNREGLCNECKAQNTAISKHLYYEKRKASGGSLKQGAQIKRCKICGKRFYAAEYQTMCSRCARKESIKKNNENRKDTTYSLSLRVPKYVHEEMKQLAADKGLSLTALVIHSYELYKRLLELSPEEQDRIIAKLPSAIDKSEKNDEYKK